MVVKRVGPMSVAKNVGILYALLGLVFGLMFSLVSMAGGFAASDESGFGAGIGAMFGVAAVITFPIIYACMGFISALIGAALYNVTAGIVGGVEMDVE